MPRRSRRKSKIEQNTSLPNIDAKIAAIERELDKLESVADNFGVTKPASSMDIQNLSDHMIMMNILLQKLADSIENSSQSNERFAAAIPKERAKNENIDLLIAIREQLKRLNKNGELTLDEYSNISKTIKDSIRGLKRDQLLTLRELIKKTNKTESEIEDIMLLVREGLEKAKASEKEAQKEKSKEELLDALYKGNFVAGLLGSLFIRTKKPEKEQPITEDSLREFFKKQKQSQMEERKPKVEPIRKPPQVKPLEIESQTDPELMKMFQDLLTPKPVSKETKVAAAQCCDELAEIASHQFNALVSIQETERKQQTLLSELNNTSSLSLIAQTTLVEDFKKYMEAQRKYQEDLKAAQLESMRENRQGLEKMSGIGAGLLPPTGIPTLKNQPQAPGFSFPSFAPTLLPKVLGAGGKAISSLKNMASAGWNKLKGVFTKTADDVPKAAKVADEIVDVSKVSKVGSEAVEMAGEKVLPKAGQEIAEKIGMKAGAKLAGKALIKKIPIIGLAAGVLFGAQRAMAGDLSGAGAEVASGVAGTIPGFGTAASVAIDAGLIARDLQKTPEQIEQEKKTKEQFSFKDKIKSIFNIFDSKETPKPISSTKDTSSFKMGSDAPLGLRLSNPGNIRDTKDEWVGKVGSESGFVKFKSAEYGIRAASKNLQTQIKRNPTMTLGEYISRYAPPNENDTEAYISRVEQETGINRNQVLPDTEDTYRKIIPSMLGIEVGGALSGPGSAREKIERLYGGEDNLNKIIASRTISSEPELEKMYSDVRTKYNYTPVQKYAATPSKPAAPKVEMTEPSTTLGARMTATTIDNFNRSIETSNQPVVVNNTPIVNNTTNVSGQGSSTPTNHLISSRNTQPVFARLQEKDFTLV